MNSMIETPKTTHGVSGGHDPTHGVGHVVPQSLLVGVLVALLILTVITVAASRIDLGFLNIWVALGIAALKASLVCLFFMHLRWDRPFNSVLLVSALFLVALFLSFCMMDTREYKPDIDAYDSYTDPSIQHQQYLEQVAEDTEESHRPKSTNEPPK